MKKPSKTEVIRAVTNDPTLSSTEFVLGGRTFKVVDLSYDDYLRFATYLGPLLEVAFGALMSIGPFNFKPADSTPINVSTILEYAGSSLPELACIVCNQTDPTLTPEDIKKLAQQSTPRGPFKLAEIVLRQIDQNKIVNDFASFFAQMLPMMKAALNLTK